MNRFEKNFYARFFSLPVSERKRIGAESGLGFDYINKHVYTTENRNPKFRFDNAVALDRASGGRLPFFLFSEGSGTIDWSYVERRLRQERQLDRKAARAEAAAQGDPAKIQPATVGRKRAKKVEPIEPIVDKNAVESKAPASVPAGRFREFWDVYPRKTDRAGCERRWVSRSLDDKADTIIAHVRTKTNTLDWKKEGGRFIPMPATYLNQSRWEETFGVVDDLSWLKEAGFSDVYEAENAGCRKNNAHLYAGGLRKA